MYVFTRLASQLEFFKPSLLLLPSGKSLFLDFNAILAGNTLLQLMKIFFIASIFGKEKFQANYQAIIDATEQAGHSIYSKHIAEPAPIGSDPESKQAAIVSYKKIVVELKKCDAVFAESSTSSTSFGFMINLAVQNGKPVIIFHSGVNEPRIFSVLEETTDKLQIIRYATVSDIAGEIQFALDFVTSAQDTRFNFFISAEIGSYLDWVSKDRKIPRSVYLRELLDRDLEQHPDFEHS